MDRVKLPYDKKVKEYISKLNSGIKPTTVDINHRFSDGKYLGNFWFRYRNDIIHTLLNDDDYKEGYDIAKKAVYSYIFDESSIENHIREYIELINSGYIPINNDEMHKFSDGKFINKFWLNYNDKIIEYVLNDYAYSKGYEKAKRIIKNLIKEKESKITNEDRIFEYIEALNLGYIPLSEDENMSFKDGKTYKFFWQSNRENIIHVLFNHKLFLNNYDTAKNIVLNILKVNSYEEYVSTLVIDIDKINHNLEKKFKGFR